MRKLVSIYRLFNILSLDIVAGAIVCALFFARLLHVQVRPVGLLALGLTVWIIYTADHLRDARHIRGRASTERHFFHQRHFLVLAVMVAIAIVADAVTIVFIRKPVLVAGIALAVVVAVYLLIQRYLRFLKELFIAALYTCGVLLPSVAVTKVDLSWAHGMTIAQFALVALTNLLIFSWYDRHNDLRDDQPSFVTLVGERATRLGIWGLIAVNMAISQAMLMSAAMNEVSFIIFLMNSVLMLVFFFRKTLGHHENYRWLGDGVFLLPVFYLL